MRGRREGRRRKERNVAFCKETGVTKARTRHYTVCDSNTFLRRYDGWNEIVLVLIGLI